MRLLNFWTLRVGAYSRWAFVRDWALIEFSPFSPSEVCLFCNKIKGCWRGPDPLNIAVNPGIFISTLLTAMRMKYLSLNGPELSHTSLKKNCFSRCLSTMPFYKLD